MDAALIDFLVSVGTMCAISAVLALITVLAEATIGNYGEVTITINDRKRLRTAGGRKLLSTLKDEKVFIPSACGGRGSCGLCKVKVLDGAGEPLATETPWLTPKELKDRVRLGCQVKVRRDLAIQIPEELLSVRQFSAQVESLRDLTHDIKEVRLRLKEPAAMDFVAGQFVQFEVPPYALSEEPVYRAYSLSSDPAEHGLIEMEIRLVPNGICTTYVHQHLKVGDAVTVNGPYGDFHLRDTAREIIFVAGGSGMAPIKSILLDMARTGNPRRARYFFGARSRRDLFLMDEMAEFERRLPNFKFIPSLGQPLDADRWTGETGLVTEVLARHVASAAEAEAYLCGSPLMIDACIKALKDKGLPEDRIYYDKFA